MCAVLFGRALPFVLTGVVSVHHPMFNMPDALHFKCIIQTDANWRIQSCSGRVSSLLQKYFSFWSFNLLSPYKAEKICQHNWTHVICQSQCFDSEMIVSNLNVDRKLPLLWFNKVLTSEMELYLIIVMWSLFLLLFKLAWLNVLVFAACQANLTAQWKASNGCNECVGSFWSRTKERERHLLFDTHVHTHSGVHMNMWICSILHSSHTP